VLKVEPLTDWPEHLDVGAVVFLEDVPTPRRVTAAERGGRVLAIGLEGIASREAAEAMVGRYLEAEAQPLPEGTYYWHQLEGLRVEDEAGSPLGVVAEVFRAGGAEVYRIEGADGGELLVPAIHDVVRRIDLDAGLMVVRYASEEVR
jgi:16S rRNA processing protein RimM